MNSVQLEEARAELGELRQNLAKLSRTPHVLYVEDDREDLEHLKKKLHPFRVRLDCCQDSRGAIELIKKDQYEVILLDLRLKNGSGLDVLSFAESEKIKSFFIVLTGMDDSDPMVKEAFSRGAHFHIQKPVTDTHLRLIFGTIA